MSIVSISATFTSESIANGCTSNDAYGCSRPTSRSLVISVGVSVFSIVRAIVPFGAEGDTMNDTRVIELDARRQHRAVIELIDRMEARLAESLNAIDRSLRKLAERYPGDERMEPVMRKFRHDILGVVEINEEAA